jgi:hypothetical protein
MYQPDSVKSAVVRWLQVQLDPMFQRFDPKPDWKLLDELKALIADIESRCERKP